MGVLSICTYPDPVLQKNCRAFEDIDGKAVALADDMVQTLLESGNGIGLAAPQVGRDLRLAVVELDPSDGRGKPLVLFNPRIIAAEGEETAEEGCLSLPDHYANVTRAARVVVEAVDRDGEIIQVGGEGLLARCLQHELDHLDGKLVLDYVSPLKRAMYRKRRLKEIKRGEG